MPGNVRELRNVVEWMVPRTRGQFIDVRMLPPEVQGIGRSWPAIARVTATTAFARMIHGKESFWTMETNRNPYEERRARSSDGLQAVPELTAQ